MSAGQRQTPYRVWLARSRCPVGATQVAMAWEFPDALSSSRPISGVRARAYGGGMTSGRFASGYKTLRKGRRSISGQIYLVTTICANRDPYFNHAETARVVAAKVTEPDLWGDSRLLCWVLMPDHMHMLIELGQARTLSALMRRVKSVSALVAHRCTGGSGQFWMPGFHDHALCEAESLRETAGYILWNPVRAGLVEVPREYPYLGAVWEDLL